VRLVELPEGDGLLVPGFIWEATTGTRWNGEGVTPDEVVKSDARTDDGEDDPARADRGALRQEGDGGLGSEAA
jgi:C-terminal processing protease CtpA/Prc